MNRLGFLGGSDMRRIMDGDWTSLWMEKTGKQEPDDLSRNLSVQLGSHTEAFNIGWFEVEHGCSVKDQQRLFELNFEGVPMRGKRIKAMIFLKIFSGENEYQVKRKQKEGLVVYFLQLLINALAIVVAKPHAKSY